MIENYSHRKLEKAKEEHEQFSPLAQLNGNWYNPNGIIGKRGVLTNNAVPASPKDDLALLLDSCGDLDSFAIAHAKFIIHAALHNFALNLLEVLESYASRGQMATFNAEAMVDFVIDVNRIADPPLNNEAIFAEVKDEYRNLWSTAANLLRPYILEQQTQALIYRELAEAKTEIENVQFDKTLVWP